MIALPMYKIKWIRVFHAMFEFHNLKNVYYQCNLQITNRLCVQNYTFTWYSVGADFLNARMFIAFE